jgi:serine/threonine-protein kinase
MILYELLTGEPAYRVDPAVGPSIDQIVCEQQPERPSVKAAAAGEAVARARSLTPERLRRRLAGDLDTIVLQALRKEPERRYGSVEQLAEDIRRHLDGRPVGARPDTFAYRTSRFVRRHRTVVAALMAVAVLTTYYTARVASERDRARREAVKATHVSEFLQALFRGSNPDESRGRTVTVRELLDRGAARIEQDLAAQPEAQADLMALMGDVYLQLGLYREATAQLDAALAARRRIGHGEDAATADILQGLSVVRRVAADYPAADALAEQAVALRRRLRGPPADLAASLNAQAEARRLLGDFRGAEASSREALALRRGALPPEHRDIADNLNNLALLIHARGDYTEAEGMHRESLAMRRRVLGEDHPEYSNSLNNLAVTLTARGDYAGAEPLYRKALALRQRILGEDEPRTLNTQRNLGTLLVEKGDETAAEATLRDGLVRMRRHLDPGHPYVADARMTLALALAMQGAHAAAAEQADMALAAQRRRLGDRHPDALRALARRARVLQLAGDAAGAEGLFRLALDRQRAVLPGQHPELVETLAGFGAVLAARGDEAAEPLLREALTIAAARLLPTHAAAREARLRLAALRPR